MLARLSLIVAAAAAICVCVATASVAQNDAPSGDKAILDLMTQKRDTLQARVDAITPRYKDGTIALVTVVDAQSDLLEAELSLARSTADRIALLGTQVENMKKIEEYFQQRFETGLTTADEVLSAKADRLEAEIALLREKALQE